METVEDGESHNSTQEMILIFLSLLDYQKEGQLLILLSVFAFRLGWWKKSPRPITRHKMMLESCFLPSRIATLDFFLLFTCTCTNAHATCCICHTAWEPESAGGGWWTLDGVYFSLSL